MNAMPFLAAILATMSPADRREAEFQAFVYAVGMVESGMDHGAIGDKGAALGAYQMHAAAWKETNEFLKSVKRPVWPRSQWRNKEAQHTMAYTFLRICERRLIDHGVKNPTPQQVYLVYAMGWESYSKKGSKPTKAQASAADRVNNLFVQSITR